MIFINIRSNRIRTILGTLFTAIILVLSASKQQRSFVRLLSGKRRYERTASVMAGSILKDIREIYSSVFDHKPVVHREVDFFVKEFEESRKDREVDRLFKILERVTELKDTEINKCKSLADIHIPKLSAELQVAESIADTLLDKRLKAEADIATRLEKKRLDRSAEWDKFVHDMTNKCIRIDSTFKEKEDEVRELYKKAEEKLIEQHQNQAVESSVVTSSVLTATAGDSVAANCSLIEETKDLIKSDSTLES